MVFVRDRRNSPDGKGCRGADTVEYAVDDVSDIQLLPPLGEAAGGSSCIVINTGEAWMLGSGGWRKL